MNSFSSKVAIITGGGSDIGKEAASRPVSVGAMKPNSSGSLQKLTQPERMFACVDIDSTQNRQ